MITNDLNFKNIVDLLRLNQFINKDKIKSKGEMVFEREIGKTCLKISGSSN